VRKLAIALGWQDPDIASLEAYRSELVDRVLAVARP
jgi:hypothetical protein